jgi:hypothetical protein
MAWHHGSGRYSASHILVGVAALSVMTVPLANLPQTPGDIVCSVLKPHPDSRVVRSAVRNEGLLAATAATNAQIVVARCDPGHRFLVDPRPSNPGEAISSSYCRVRHLFEESPIMSNLHPRELSYQRRKQFATLAMIAIGFLAVQGLNPPAHAWTRTLGSETIDLTTGLGSPNQWVSPATGSAGPNESLQGGITITYNASAANLAAIAATGSYTATENLIFLDENTFPRRNTILGYSNFTLSISAPAQPFTFVPPSFVTTLGPRGNTTDFRIDGYNSWTPNNKSSLVTLTKLPVAGAPVGGAAGGPATSTIPVTSYAANLQAEDVPLRGGVAAIYTFSSPDGLDYIINGGNQSGYTLVNSSTDQLVYSGLDDPINPSVTFDPSATFQSLYSNGAAGIGHVLNTGATFAIQASGFTAPLDSYSTTSLPFDLPSDGQTVDLSASSLSPGNDALWLDFKGQSPGSDVGFLIVFVPEPSSMGLLLIGIGAMLTVAINRRRIIAPPKASPFCQMPDDCRD